MSYVEKVLQPGEEILARSRLHWFVYLSTLIYLVIALAAAVATMLLPDDGMRLPLIATAIFALLALLAFFSAWIRRATTELA